MRMCVCVFMCLRVKNKTKTDNLLLTQPTIKEHFQELKQAWWFPYELPRHYCSLFFFKYIYDMSFNIHIEYCDRNKRHFKVFQFPTYSAR